MSSSACRLRSRASCPTLTRNLARLVFECTICGRCKNRDMGRGVIGLLVASEGFLHWFIISFASVVLYRCTITAKPWARLELVVVSSTHPASNSIRCD